MSNRFRVFVSSLTASTVVLMMLSTASAQEVRTYGDQGSNSGGSGGGGQNSQSVYPGQPTNQQTQQGQQSASGQAAQQQGENAEGQENVGSYEIKLHDSNRFDQEQREQSGQQTERLDKPANQMYRGIIPGDRDSVAHLQSERESGQSSSNPNRLTWIGFQPREESSRVFLQMARTPEYSVSRKEDGSVVVITLENAQVSTGNFRRRIETQYFERGISRIDTKVTGNDTVELQIRLESAANPSVETEEDYLYVDFPYDNPDDESSDGSDDTEEE